MSTSPSLGEQREVSLGGTTLRYREVGGGPVLLFMHGLLVNGDLWRKVVPRLSDRFRCITPDLPLGSHELPIGRDSRFTSPRGVAALVAELIAALDLQGVTVVANDTGGAIAQILVTEHPGAAARLVLTPCDCFEHFLPPAFKHLQVGGRWAGFWWLAAQSMRLGVLRNGPLGFGLLVRRPIPRDIADSYLGPVRRDPAIRRDLAAFVRRISKRDTIAAGRRLGDFQQPVLIAWSDSDLGFPRRYGERLAAAFGPNALLTEVGGSRTFVPEDQPEALATLIGGFAG